MDTVIKKRVSKAFSNSLKVDDCKDVVGTRRGDLFGRRVESRGYGKARVKGGCCRDWWVSIKSKFVTLLMRIYEHIGLSSLKLRLPLDKGSNEYKVKSFINTMIFSNSNALDVLVELKELGVVFNMMDNKELISGIFREMGHVQVNKIYGSLQKIEGLMIGLGSFSDDYPEFRVMLNELRALELYASRAAASHSLVTYDLNCVKVEHNYVVDGKIRRLLELLIDTFDKSMKSEEDIVISISEKEEEIEEVDTVDTEILSNIKIDKLADEILCSSIKKELNLESALISGKYKFKKVKLTPERLLTTTVLSRQIAKLSNKSLFFGDKLRGFYFLKGLYQLVRVYKTESDVKFKIDNAISVLGIETVKYIYKKMEGKKYLEMLNVLKVLGGGEGVTAKMFGTMYVFALNYKEACERVLSKYVMHFSSKKDSTMPEMLKNGLMDCTKENFRKVWAWGQEYDKAFGSLMHDLHKEDK